MSARIPDGKEGNQVTNPKGAWKAMVGGLLLQFAVCGLVVNCFSVYLPYLLQKCGLTNAESASILLVRNIFTILSLLVVGKVYDKLELRVGITCAVVLGAVSMLIFSEASSLRELIIASSVAGLAYGFGGMYAVSMLLHRWFRIHEAFALGICTASTGLATVIGAPMITALVEYGSVSSALRVEGVFLFLCAVGCVCLIRNYPADMTRQPETPKIHRKPFRFTRLHLAAALTGVAGSTAFQFLAVHFSAEGLRPFEVSTLVSVAGLSLMAGKFLFGEAVDRWGAYKSNWIFFGTSIGGCFLICCSGSFLVAMIAVIAYAAGLAFSTIGLTVYACDLQSERFSDSVREFQICLLVGALLSSQIGGYLADWTGSYVAFYLLTAGVTLLSLLMIELEYRRKRKAA